MAVICPKCDAQNNDSAKFCAECGYLLDRSNSHRQYSAIIEEGSLLVNRYRIIRLLKAGGMGAVYCAEDGNLGKICAIKELISFPHSTDKERQYAIDKFQSEAKTLANLHHISLPRVYDYFTIDDRYYLTMDFVDGKDLLTILKEKGNPGLPEKDVIKWSIEICDVLSYLHSRTPVILYRDIKPSNIMIRSIDEKVILIDFGIAKALQDDTNPKTAIGTMGYISPEQFRGLAVPASDIYSLGATMNHLLTGIMPIPFTYEPVKKRVPEVSDGIEGIIKKSIDLKPENRFHSGEEMKEALLNLLGDKVISVSSQSLSEIDLAIIQLKASSSKARLEAINKLTNVQDERIVLPLIEILSDPQPSIRKEAAIILGKLKDPSAMEPLIKMLKDKDLNVRIAALTSLGNPRYNKAFPYIIAALKDEDYRVRKHASLALGDIGDDRAIEPLKEARNKEGFLSFGMRMTMDKAIQKLEALKAADTGKEEKYSTNELLPEITVRFHEARNYNERGLEYYKENKYDLAIKSFQKALEINPTYVEAHFNIGRVILQQFEHIPDSKSDNKINDALVHLKKCIELASDATIASEARSYLETLTEEWNKLQKWEEETYEGREEKIIEEITGSDPDFSGELSVDKAVKTEEEKIEEKPKEKSEEEKIEEEIEEKEIEEKVEEKEIEEEIEEKVEEKEIEEEIEEKIEEKEKIRYFNSIQERINYYQETLKGSPDDPIIYNELGQAYFEYGNVFLSENNYRKALELAPNYAEAHFNIALLYKDLGLSLKDDKKVEDCLVHFEDAIKFTQDDDIISKSREYIDEIIRQVVESEEPAKLEAIEPVGEEIKLEEVSEVKKEPAKKEIEEEKQEIKKYRSPEERISYYQEILKGSHDDPVIYNELGHAYFDYGNVFLSENNYRKALELVPDYAEAHFNIALLYKDLGISLNDDKKLEDCLAHFENAIKFTQDEDIISKARANIDEIKKQIVKSEEPAKVEAVEPVEEEIKLEEVSEVKEEPDKKDVEEEKQEIKKYRPPEERISYYHEILKASPDDPVIYNELGHAYFEYGNVFLADTNYRKALELSPNYAEAHFNIALLYKDLGLSLNDDKKVEDCLAHFEDAIKFTHDEDIISKARANIDEMTKQISKNVIPVRLEELIPDVKEIKLEEISEVKEEPDKKEEKQELKQEIKSYRSPEERISYYQEILKVSPDEPAVYNELGQAYFAQGNVFLADTNYRKALGLTPDYAEAHFNIALLYKDLGFSLNDDKRLEDCLVHFEDSIKFSHDENIISKARANIDEIKNQMLKSQEPAKGETVEPIEEEIKPEEITELKEREEISPEFKMEAGFADLKGDPIEYYQDLIKKFPDDSTNYNKLGLAYYEKKLLDQAQKQYEKALKLDPRFAEAHLNLGLLYKDKNNILKSLRHIKLCIKMSKDELLIKKAKNYIRDIEDLEEREPEKVEKKSFETREVKKESEILETIPSDTRRVKKEPEIVKSRETKELKIEDLKSAIKDSEHIKQLIKILEKEPENLDANINIAQLYRQSGELDKALEHYKKILSIKQDEPKTYLDIAIIYREQKRFPDALEYLTICAKKANNSELLAEAKKYISQIEDLFSKELKEDGDEIKKIDLKQKEEEINKYEEILKTNPDDLEVRMNLARLYKDLEEFDKSIIHYKEYLKIKNKDDRAHMEIALIYRNKGNVINALKHLRRCINLTKDKNLKQEAEDYISQIESFSLDEVKKEVDEKHKEEAEKIDRKGGDEKSLIDNLKKELKEKPDDILLLNRLGEVYYRAGNLKLSLDNYLKILKIDPSESKTYFNVGSLYKEQGKIVKALIHFKKYIMLAPEGEFINQVRNYIKELE